MPDVSFVFHVHCRWPLRRHRVFDIGLGRPYFDESLAAHETRSMATASLVPAADRLARLARDEGLHAGLAVSGTAIEQLAAWAPHALESLQRLADLPGIDLVGQTYNQSLAEVGDIDEFIDQVGRHRMACAHYFGRLPGTVFRGTDLFFDAANAPLLERIGYRGAMVEPSVPDTSVINRPVPLRAGGFSLLPCNRRLSDDIAVRFGDRGWDRWPLTAERFAGWIAASPGTAVVIDLDMSAFGGRHPADTGIFEFLEHVPVMLRRFGVAAVAPSALVGAAPMKRPVRGRANRPDAGLRLQTPAAGSARLPTSAIRRLFAHRPEPGRADPVHVERWRRLTAVDAFRPMLDDAVARPRFASRYDAYLSFCNIVDDLETAMNRRSAAGRAADTPPKALPTRVAGPVVPVE